MDKTYSLADIAAVSGDRNDGIFGGDSSGFIVLILFLIMLSGGAGFGWGGNGNGALTRAELSQGFADNTVLRKLDGITDGLCDGFYAQNTTMLNGFNGLGQEIANNRFAQQNCCCNIERNIDSVKYENAQNTCAIVNAIKEDGDKTRNLLTQSEIQALRDKLQDTRFELSQVNQNATIIGALQQKAPIPAYTVMSPYMSNLYACNGYGTGCGCSQFA